MHENRSRRAVTGAGQHGRPEQGMKINDVLTDEMVELGIMAGTPIIIEMIVAAIAENFKTGHVTDGGIHPDIEVFVGLTRDFETEIGRIARDVPFLQFIIQPFTEFIGDSVVKGSATRPNFQHVRKRGQGKEEMLRFFFDGCRTRNHGPGISQLRGTVGRSTGFTIVAILVLGLAFRAGPNNVSVC